MCWKLVVSRTFKNRRFLIVLLLANAIVPHCQNKNAHAPHRYLDYVLFEFCMKCRKGFVGISGDESRPNHASNVGRFLCKVYWSQHVLNFKPCKHVILAASFCTEEAQEDPVA